jgi:hypothetical protein
MIVTTRTGERNLSVGILFRIKSSHIHPVAGRGANEARKENVMPATSKKQQMAAGAALSAKKGERSKSSLKGASKSMYESMSASELRRMASTKRKGKPTSKSKKSG